VLKSTSQWSSFHSQPATLNEPGKVSAAGSALLNATTAGDLAALQQLLQQEGITVNDCDYDRRRPLHLAAAEGRLEIARFLLEHKADVNIEDRWGHTPLDEAVNNRHEEVME
jgi:glutaminase